MRGADLSMTNVFSRDAVFFMALLFSTLFFDSALGFWGGSLYGALGLSFLLFVLCSRSLPLIEECTFVVALLFCFSLTLFMTYARWNHDAAQLKNFLAAVAGLVCYLGVSAYRYAADRSVVATLLSTVILLHVSVFLLQMLLWVCLSFDLDVGRFLGGEGHRAVAGDGMYRATGVFDEPAVYCMFMAALLVLRYIYTAKADVIFYAGLLTMGLSFSAVGIFFCAALMAIDFVMRRGVILHVSAAAVIGLAVVFILAGDHLLLRLDAMLAGQDGSMKSKLIIISSWFSDPELMWSGYGFIGLRDWTPYFFDAIYDLTLYLTVFSQFGIVVGLCVFLLLMLRVMMSAISPWHLLMVLVIFIKLSALQYVFFWFFLALLPLKRDASASSAEQGAN